MTRFNLFALALPWLATSVCGATPPIFASAPCESALVRVGVKKYLQFKAGYDPAELDEAQMHHCYVELARGSGLDDWLDGLLVVLPSGDPVVVRAGLPAIIEPSRAPSRVLVSGQTVLECQGTDWAWASGVRPPRRRDPGLAAFVSTHQPVLTHLIRAGRLTLDDVRAARLTPFRWELDDEAWALRVPRPHGLDEILFFTTRPDVSWPASVVMKNFVPHRDFMEVGEELLYAARVPSTGSSVAYLSVPNVDLTTLDLPEPLAYLVRERAQDMKQLLIAPTPVTAEDFPRLRVETAYEHGESVPLYVVSRPGANGRGVLLVDLSYSSADLEIKFHRPITLRYGDGRRVRVQYDGTRWIFGDVVRQNEMTDFIAELAEPVGARFPIDRVDEQSPSSSRKR